MSTYMCICSQAGLHDMPITCFTSIGVSCDNCLIDGRMSGTRWTHEGHKMDTRWMQQGHAKERKGTQEGHTRGPLGPSEGHKREMRETQEGHARDRRGTHEGRKMDTRETCLVTVPTRILAVGRAGPGAGKDGGGARPALPCQRH